MDRLCFQKYGRTFGGPSEGTLENAQWRKNMYPLCLLNLCFYRKKESVVFKDMTGHLEDASVFMAHIKVYAKVKHLFIDIALSKTIFELLLEIDVRLSGRLCSQNWINFRLFIA